MSSGFNNQPLINGEAYAFAQVAIVIRGQRIYGVTSVDYTQEENKGHNFGPGRYPVSRGYGEVDSNGNMDLDQDAVVKLTDMAPNRKLFDMDPFDVVVTYRNQKRIVVDVLRECEFNNHNRSSSQGDTRNNSGFPLIIADIDWG